MDRERKPSPQTLAVALELGAAAGEWRHGYELCKETGLKAGSMYPILIRLAERGLLETCWEAGAPGGRPPRHLYRLTGMGRAWVKELARERAQEERGRLKLRAEGAV